MLRVLSLAVGLVFGLSLPALAEDNEAPHALNYLAPDEVDLSKILPSPPKPDSPAQKRDLAISLAFQKTRTPEMIALAKADADRSIFRFGVIFGDRFTKEQLPVSAAFFGRVLDDERSVGALAKAFWSRPRPFVASALVHPCVEEPPTNSYPSNHATTGMLYAQILAAALPEQRRQIIARADQYAKDRVVCGVHYETDIEAGKRAGAIEARAMFGNAAFRHDFAEARAELRRVLLAR